MKKDIYTVEKDGAYFRIRPVRSGYSADKLVEFYSSTSMTDPDMMEDGSGVYYDGEWFIIRDYMDGRKETIAILTRI